MTQTPEARPRAGRLPRTARRAQLLDVALDVFVEQGYHSASMDEIAERAGVSKPVLYQHFPGKLDLYTALVSSAVDTVIEGVRSALASTQDNSERVQATMRLWYDCVANQEKAFRLVFESDLTSDPEVSGLVDRVTSESAAAIAEVIVEDTGLSRGAAELLAAGLVGMGHVGARAWLSGASGLTRDDAVTLASTLAWRGIGGFPKPTNEGDE
ncbi:TetR family transcriptional regulator [Aeromicrobium sp. 636]|uniref:TetR/AcrR family transcriptional regulator n=1 Tax=Aeromicrobium senzhongii TaxID=2663859 RepID=A0A8I0EVR6_9ACTN|nr:MULTISPECIES: TetR/AcrR family transcriptional regulator [Aeromicrobium]MBC9226429.1 TetR/AcrR family transcriptional regulator [Aeromicrobium senzhongii]MCQ3998534.1 TetR family transcriptional regulator [Aeromicrobium sp. 636]MTB88985.1 TetR family transcriptional regulator [Aeromicrobium senzhongii]QNL93736.1 TetR/AcrR family transcriptional regulator [Aeromicrobium senzhongii]